MYDIIYVYLLFGGLNMTVKERFLKYVKYETTSDENSGTCPSTAGQKVLLNAVI